MDWNETKWRYSISLIPQDPEGRTLEVQICNQTGRPQRHYGRKRITWEECSDGLKALELDPEDKPDSVPELFRQKAILCVFHSHCSVNQLANAGLIG
jgi:hypothetical protein